LYTNCIRFVQFSEGTVSICTLRETRGVHCDIGNGVVSDINCKPEEQKAF